MIDSAPDSVPSLLRRRLKGMAKSGNLGFAAATLSTAVLSRLGFLAMSVLLARQFGPTDYGIFIYATTIALIFGQLSTLGWPLVMNRLIPEFREAKKWDALKGLLNSGMAVVLLASIITGAIIFVSGFWFPGLQRSLQLGAFLVPFFALAILRKQQLVAVRKGFWGVMLDQGFGAIIVSITLLVIGIATVEGAIGVFAAGTFAAALFASLVFRRIFAADLAGRQGRYRIGPWFAMALPMILGQSSKLLLMRTSVLFIAAYATLADVGLYGAASRLTYILSFFQMVLTLIITPLISEAFAKKNIKRVRMFIKLAAMFTTILLVPVTIGCVIFSEPLVVFLFGAEFRDAAPIFSVLLIGQLAACYSGVFATVLMMGGKERMFAVWNVALLAVNIGLCILLIPLYGAMGAAMITTGVAIAMLLVQILQTIGLFRHFGKNSRIEEAL